MAQCTVMAWEAAFSAATSASPRASAEVWWGHGRVIDQRSGRNNYGSVHRRGGRGGLQRGHECVAQGERGAGPLASDELAVLDDVREQRPRHRHRGARLAQRGLRLRIP